MYTILWLPYQLSGSTKVNAGKLLLEHRKNLLSEDKDYVRTISVRRKHILDDALFALKRVSWKPSQHFRVIFIGEPGIDDGGPTREFFRLIIDEMSKKEMLFEGPPTTRVPRHNTMAMEERAFFYMGQLIALSILNNGPCVHWLAPTVVSYILGEEGPVFIDDIPDSAIAAKVRMVCHAVRK